MSIQVYNSLTKKKEKFIPQHGRRVLMYSCGVTVYDHCHIGHARSLYIFETIRKYFKYREYDMRFVRNITDIDDKIIDKAKELSQTSEEVAQKNIEGYRQDLKSLGIEEADQEPKATENIEDMISDIQGLVEKGYAYEVGGNVYYSVRKFKNYGKLSGQAFEKMLEAVRIEADEKKKDPLDFAVWKKSKEDEPGWDSPWGRGRPGWHMECSVMSRKYLQSDTLDIHAGGRDLIFPHHENEIAQAEALTEKTFVRYWIHHGLLTINGQKMAKSAGNFVTIQDALKKYHANYLKLFFLSSHYRSPVDYSDEKMEDIKRAYERILILVRKLDLKLRHYEIPKIIQNDTGKMELYRKKFREFMDDDFNTPRALATIYELVNECNKFLDNEEKDEEAVLAYAKDTIVELMDIFGIDFPEDPTSGISDAEIRIMVNFRETYKQKEDYAQADQIRKELEKKGVILEDTKEGTTWRRKV